MIDVDRIVSKIGIDIDKKGKVFLSKVQKDASAYGIIKTTDSKKGFHIDVELFTPVKLKESLWIRFYLHDDPLRILFDALRILSDIDNLDVLWDEKQKIQINTIMKKVDVLS